jgi:hypothetical protein
MRPTLLLSLSLFFVIAGACAHEDAGPSPAASPPVSSASPVAQEPAGGTATPEPGETPTQEFKGTTSTAEVKRSNLAPALLRAVRTGRHAGFDRVVFEFEGNAVPGYHIEFGAKPVKDCGEGAVVPVSAEAVMLIRLQPANAHTEAGVATVTDRQRNPNLPILKELKLICDFEAQVEWVAGIKSRNPYRVTELTNPARLVVDIRQ